MKNAPDRKAAESALEQRHDTASDLFPGTLPTLPAPILPKLGTVKDAALAAIIAGKVTQAEFRRSWRLAAYIEDLTEDGWSICSEWVQPPGWHDPIKRYWIDLQDGPTRAAVDAYRKQRGFIASELVTGLALLTPAVAGVMAALARWLA